MLSFLLNLIKMVINFRKLKDQFLGVVLVKKRGVQLKSLKKKGLLKKGKGDQTTAGLYHGKKIKGELLRKEKELETLKTLLEQKEMEIKRLREEINYKNQQLASKDIEMETYKNVTEGKIFKLEAKVKELEAKINRQK